MELTLDEYRRDLKKRRFMALPTAGAIVWLVVALSSVFATDVVTSLIMVTGTCTLVYFASAIAHFTGERFITLHSPTNPFEQLLVYCFTGSLCAYALIIPLYMQDISTLPLTVGVLASLIWLPYSWIIEHWVGVVHVATRMLLLPLAWYFFPEYRFTLIPMLIFALYVFTAMVLEHRWRYLGYFA